MPTRQSDSFAATVALNSELNAGRDAAAQAALRSPRRVGPGAAVCRPAFVLKLMTLMLVAVTLALLPATDGWRDALLRLPGPLCAALAAGLIWLPALCAWQDRLARFSDGVQTLLVALGGAASALVGWALVWLLGVAPAGVWPAAMVALAGAGVALALWVWLKQRHALGRPADANARLTELQSRIRPHFLFNTLNTALVLVQADPPRAEQVLEDLASLFRAALVEDGSAVRLDDEIDLARRYLAIEQLRFGDRLNVHWELDARAGAALLPPLVLQPLVENAVRHGIEPSRQGGSVRVKSRARHGMAEIEVENTLPPGAQPFVGDGFAATQVQGEAISPGVPNEPPDTRSESHGIALANVRERLHLLHDMAATFETRVRDGWYCARITVPL